MYDKAVVPRAGDRIHFLIERRADRIIHERDDDAPARRPDDAPSVAVAHRRKALLRDDALIFRRQDHFAGKVKERLMSAADRPHILAARTDQAPAYLSRNAAARRDHLDPRQIDIAGTPAAANCYQPLLRERRISAPLRIVIYERYRDLAVPFYVPNFFPVRDAREPA